MERPSKDTPMVRTAYYFLLCAAMITMIITLRLMSDGRRGLDRAAAAMEKGDRETAAAALEDAAKAYVPGARHVPRALRDLSVLARAAEMRGEEESALKIWKIIRRAVLATRHILQPNAASLNDAEKAILRLSRGEGSAQNSDMLVRRPDDPSPVLSLLLFLGLSLWVVGAALLVFKPETKSSPLVSPRVSALVCLGGLALWLLCAWLV